MRSIRSHCRQLGATCRRRGKSASALSGDRFALSGGPFKVAGGSGKLAGDPFKVSGDSLVTAGTMGESNRCRHVNTAIRGERRGIRPPWTEGWSAPARNRHVGSCDSFSSAPTWIEPPAMSLETAGTCRGTARVRLHISAPCYMYTENASVASDNGVPYPSVGGIR